MTDSLLFGRFIFKVFPYILSSHCFSGASPERANFQSVCLSYLLIVSVRHHPNDPIIQPLESQGIKRLYPQNVDHKKELKKMNHSLLANFLDLLDVMVKNPGGPKHPGSPPPGVGSLREEKIEDIQLLFFHIHHLINEFRPHQASPVGDGGKAKEVIKSFFCRKEVETT